MWVTHIKVTNFRALQSVELRFQPGFNLIVGVNGAGKTTILDALAICLSAIVTRANGLPMHVKAFGTDDIRVGAEVLDIKCSVKCDGKPGYVTVHKLREGPASRQVTVEIPCKQAYIVSNKQDEPRKLQSNDNLSGPPLAVLFSTRRTVPSGKVPSKGATAGGMTAAIAEAFSDRELRLRQLAAWMRVQQVLSAERPEAGRMLMALESAVMRFLPAYTNLHLDREDSSSLLIDLGNITLPLHRLSGGERGVLALVLDLTRRLALANPGMNDPASTAEAVVLIDKIDLHLHPKWQRRIVSNLTAAFPRCQFIATTNSPQVIGEIEHERIQIISEGEVYSPTRSFGVDSSRVLEEIMDTDPRNEMVQKLLSQINSEIGATPFGQARITLNSLAEHLGENDPEVTRLQVLLDFMEGNE